MFMRYMACCMYKIITEWESYLYFYWRTGNQGEGVFLAPCSLNNKALRVRLPATYTVLLICMDNNFYEMICGEICKILCSTLLYTVLLNCMDYDFYEMICEETCKILCSTLLSLSL